MGSDTFALGMRAEGLNKSKALMRLNHEERILDMARTLGGYRREIQFFRTVHSATDALLLGVRAVIQQMILNFYLRPELDGQRDEQWLALSEELDRLLQGHVSKVGGAEKEWLELSARNMIADHSSTF
nr:hypothetical protein LTR18_009730 [Exophiala xenobiotica]